ncbi:phage tail tube protein [Paenibacillus ginsengarvi]|uniref:Phage portal protein n=1 Tax=Paenibacillus ginsengarvi TaxID=400777 RepID=A0A3B0CNN9_9BACL|nr:phage tail tube protein [Paenibacillus ginsengarvi]RKN85869.1 phage portal protein [Paenibacillus ginsengarvi]
MAILNARDTISGQDGTAFATINGENIEMFYVKKLEAKIEKDKTEIKTLGRRGTQHKTTGWKGTGTMTIFYVTSRFRKMMIDYVDKGEDTYFSIKVTNDDSASGAGRQVVILKDVNLDSVIMAALDTDSTALEEEVAFTFDGIELNTIFTELS